MTDILRPEEVRAGWGMKTYYTERLEDTIDALAAALRAVDAIVCDNNDEWTSGAMMKYHAALEPVKAWVEEKP